MKDADRGSRAGSLACLRREPRTRRRRSRAGSWRRTSATTASRRRPSPRWRHAAQATTPQRWEALGAARRRAARRRRRQGQRRRIRGGVPQLREGPRRPALPLLAVGGAIPGKQRWEEVWRQVTLDVDRRDAERPLVRVRWPGVPSGLCPCTGTAVSLDFKDGDFQQIFRLFADISGLNVVVQPGTQGSGHLSRGATGPGTRCSSNCSRRTASSRASRATSSGSADPRKRASDGRSPGSRSASSSSTRDWSRPSRRSPANGHCERRGATEVAGHVTLKLDDVPWDQAFDLLATVNGLTWTRTGDVIHMAVHRRSR